MDALVSHGPLTGDRRSPAARLTAGLLGALDRDDPRAALCLPLSLLIARHLRFDAADPLWPDRDRLVLSPDAVPLGESAADLLGTSHEMFHVAQPALAGAAGLALAERMLAARFGRSLVDHRTWAIGGFCDLATGAEQEAAWLAGAWRLGRLHVIHAVTPAQLPGLAGFASKGWSVRRATAGNEREIAGALSAALRSAKPTLIAIVQAQGDPAIADCGAGTDVPADMRPAWLAAGCRAAGLRRAWLKRLARHAGRGDFERTQQGRLPLRWHVGLGDPAGQPPQGRAGPATSVTVRQALPRLAATVPEVVMLPGAAGWTLPGGQTEPACARGPAAGRLVLGTTALLGGIARHGGLLPVVAHGLDDMDTIRSGLRDAARDGLQVVHILVEPASGCPTAGQRSGLRAMRNLFVFRPADASEALACLELALRRTAGPSVLLLSDTPIPLLGERPGRTHAARGGYLMAAPAGPRAATLIASGAELHLANQAQQILTRAGVPTALVCLPCWDLFAQQDSAWQDAVLGNAPRIGIEAGSGFGWERWLAPGGLFIPWQAADGDAVGDETAGAPVRRIADAVIRFLDVAAAV